jgi:4-hydroxythreonine-4-phosphate dehydrogenase
MTQNSQSLPESRPRPIGITTGDPAGIGPEISLKAALSPELPAECALLLFGDVEILRRCARDLGLRWDWEPVSTEGLAVGGPLPRRGVVHVPARGEDIVPGRGSVASGASAAHNIMACEPSCRSGHLRAMVTAPLNKKFLNEAGFAFPGHTEFLAHLSGVSRFAMAFLTDRLKVVLATIHIPLQAVTSAITADLIREKLEILLTEFPALGLPCRRIAVAGLNPHAGEEGLLGREEIEVMVPALAGVRASHPDVDIAGPLPADTLFHRAVQGEFDAVLALYHDQGLIPVKLLGFGQAVNVTLGLPYVRTSVDHGTAYEIAGKNCARPDSLLTAIHWALRLSHGSR